MAARAPATLAVANYHLMKEPLQGHQMKVLLSTKRPFELGEFTITGADTGTWSPETVGAAELAAENRDIVAMVIVNQGIPDAGNEDIVLTIAGTNASDEVISGTATFKVPAYADNATVRKFARGFAVDVTVAAGADFKTITGVTVACAAGAANAVIALYALPEITDFTQVACLGAGMWQPRVLSDQPIRCGNNPSRFVKEGDLLEGMLELESKYFSGTSGLAPFLGIECVALLQEVRGSNIVTTNHYCTQFRPSAPTRWSEGPEAASLNTGNRFSENLSFYAPSAT